MLLSQVKGTMDKASPEVRDTLHKSRPAWCSQTPDTAFKIDAETEVTSDIIFRAQPWVERRPDWSTSRRGRKWHYNEPYFAGTPEQIMERWKCISPYGMETPARQMIADHLRQLAKHLNITGQIDD